MYPLLFSNLVLANASVCYCFGFGLLLFWFMVIGWSWSRDQNGTYGWVLMHTWMGLLGLWFVIVMVGV